MRKTYEKAALYMMLELRLLVNFTTVLCATFSHKNVLEAFRCLQFSFVIFGKRVSAQKLQVKCWLN